MLTSIHWSYGSLPGVISVQWDIMFYQFDGVISYDRYLSSVDPVICPEAESRFYVSFYNPDESTSYGAGYIAVFDESNEGHGWDHICLAPSPFTTSTYSSNSYCTGVYSGHKQVTTNAAPPLVVGGSYGDNNLMVFNIPRCYRRFCCDWSDPDDHLYDEEGYIIEAEAGTLKRYLYITITFRCALQLFVIKYVQPLKHTKFANTITTHFLFII